MWLLILLLICFFVFLFVSYALSKEDYLLLRKNITLDQIFDMSFVLAGVSLLFSRLIYVAIHPNPGYFNPLVFFVFPYYPGLSFWGGVVGAVLWLLFFTDTKFPVKRVSDFFGVGLICSSTVGIIGYEVAQVIQKKSFPLQDSIITFLYITTCSIFLFVFLPHFKKGELKEGSLGLLSLVSISILIFIFDALSKSEKIWGFLGADSVVAVILLGISLFYFLKQEKFISTTWVEKLRLR